MSGAANHRAQLHRLLKAIDAGDIIIVTRLDRLARSTRDLLNILDKIAKAGATFKSLGDTWADTTTAHGRLMLTVLGGLAEFERELIRVRTGEGRVRAKARGVPLRLTTARYFTPSGRSIQAKGISPDIEVLQEVPEELKARTDMRGEASLRGHLKAEGGEQTGSQSYIPPDPKDDKALHTALDLIRGIQKNSAYPPAVPN
jgi:DNA invertase Pin-like site-specific DNA recombinase